MLKIPNLITDKIEHPLNDHRKYRAIKLANELEVLLINDPEIEQASASLSVRVGSFDDPTNIPGLAHFCEHLLFMGTKKYPTEDEYSHYLSNHNGSSNAFTSTDETNYYFEVGKDHLEGALDRFSQFFVNPLFLDTCQGRELQAIESENNKNLKSDYWRLYQLQKALCNPLHPFSKFTTGNQKSLEEIPHTKGINVHESLINFYNHKYSSNIMKLVVLGHDDLDTLEDMVTKRFTAIENRHIPPPFYGGEQPLTRAQLSKIIKARTLMDNKKLTMTFPIHDQMKFWETRPADYVSHLISHEGEGSLLQYFKEQGWATSLSSGATHICKGSDTFTINVDLTHRGLQHYQDIAVSVFQYLNMLQHVGPQNWIYDEMKYSSLADFQYRSRRSPMETTSRLSSILQQTDIPRSNCLSVCLYRRFDKVSINQLLNQLSPHNFRILLASKDFDDLDQEEPWYSTSYKLEDMNPEFLTKIKVCAPIPNPMLHLPRQNNYIPKDLSVKKEHMDKNTLKRPILIDETENTKLWFKQDDTFLVPKGYVGITLRNPSLHASPKISAKSALFSDLVEDALSELKYEANLGGLSFTLCPSFDGFHLKLFGYNEKVKPLFQEIMKKLKSLEVERDRFDMLKDKLLQCYTNFGLTAPYNQIGHYSHCLLNERTWNCDEKIAALKTVTFEDLKDYAFSVFDNVDYDLLVYGNFNQTEAFQFKSIANSILQAKPLAPTQRVMGRSYLLQEGDEYHVDIVNKNKNEINSCVDYFIQIGQRGNTRNRALLSLATLMSDSYAFNELRSKEQLGYIVFTGFRTTRTTMGLRILVQGELPTSYVEARIDRFLNNFEKYLRDMSDNDFDLYKRALIEEKLEQFNSLCEEGDHYWNRIISGFYDFDTDERDVEALKKISKRELIYFFLHYISPQSPSRAKLVVHANSGRFVSGKQSISKVVQSSIKNNLLLKNVTVSSGIIKTMVDRHSNAIESLNEILSELRVFLLFTWGKNAVRIIPDIAPSIISQLDQKYLKLYPSGQAIKNITRFKSSLPLSSAPMPVLDLEDYRKCDYAS